MADNVYLLETRLSSAQRGALDTVRSVAREQGLTVFLVGGAVRDLMSGSPVRDLDVVVQGNALTLRKELEAAGATYSGQSLPLQSLYVRFPSGVRMEVGSTLSSTYPKPGKPVYTAATILDDLRRRDFTANAMALSLNEGSYGLLMDPLNGVADIENRELRLVSNYGFIEDPARLIRAARFMARLGWQMDERTRARYETAKEENYVGALQAADRAYELEELFHEEEPLRVLRRLEDEGWLSHLSPALGVAKVNTAELTRLRESQMQLETSGIRADAAAANFPLLTAKVPPADVAAMKKSFPRTAFAEEIDSLETSAKELGNQLLSKAMSLPSEAYKLIHRSAPATVLWTMHSSRSATLQARFKSFHTEWPVAQTKLPVLLMSEMRITPDLPGYAELQETLFYALMDGRLGTPEEMRAFLEPYSPPAPPPPVSLRRPRAPRKEAKAPKSRKKAVEVEATPVGVEEPVAPPAPATPVETAKAPVLVEKKPATKRAVPPAPAPPKATSAKADIAKKVAEPRKPTVAKKAAVAAPKVDAKKAPAKKTNARTNPKLKQSKTVPGKPAGKVAKTVTKQKAATVPAKTPAKKPTPTKPAKKFVSKVAAKKPVSKPAAAKQTAPAKKSVAKKAPAAKRR